MQRIAELQTGAREIAEREREREREREKEREAQAGKKRGKEDTMPSSNEWDLAVSVQSLGALHPRGSITAIADWIFPGKSREMKST